jgi:prevent-host-death family protein
VPRWNRRDQERDEIRKEMRSGRDEVFSDHQQVRAVTVTELDRNASAVLADVARGARVIVTKHGMPTALIVSIDDGLQVMLAGSEGFALLRREAREQLEAGGTTVLERWRPGASRSG